MVIWEGRLLSLKERRTVVLRLRAGGTGRRCSGVRGGSVVLRRRQKLEGFAGHSGVGIDCFHNHFFRFRIGGNDPVELLACLGRAEFEVGANGRRECAVVQSVEESHARRRIVNGLLGPTGNAFDLADALDVYDWILGLVIHLDIDDTEADIAVRERADVDLHEFGSLAVVPQHIERPSSVLNS